MSDDVLVRVEGVSKKFCRSLKRSLWYGVRDVSSELFGSDGHHNQLRKNEFWAVDDVSFELRRGECLGLIGPNGAGKSTLLKMLNGLVKPDKGRISMRGRIGALIELGAGFNPILTARENIYVNGSILGFTKSEISKKFEAIVDFAEVEDFIDTPVQSFSSGMKVRLGFAVAAQMEPDVLIIDEVLAVGDEKFRLKSLNQISRISRKATVILVSHAMPMISRISTSVLLIDHGRESYHGANVQKGITQYLKNVGDLEDKQNHSSFFELVGFELSGAGASEGDGSGVFELGKEFCVDLRLKLLREVPPFIINITFMDGRGESVAQCSSAYSNLVFDFTDSIMGVRVVMPELQLNPGKYFVNIGLIESLSPLRQGEVLYHKRGVGAITVVGNMTGWAPVQLSSHWKLDRPEQ